MFFFKVLLEEMPGGRLEIEVRNRVGEGQLNEGCGAEWAQKVNSSGVSVSQYFVCMCFVCNGLSHVESSFKFGGRYCFRRPSRLFFFTATYGCVEFCGLVFVV